MLIEEKKDAHAGYLRVFGDVMQVTGHLEN